MGRSSFKRQRWADHYTDRAKKENYPARSVYKLQEIQKRYKIIKPGDRILDLGCAPGSWLQFAAEQATARGRVIGIDLNPVSIPLPAHVTTFTGDILSLDEMPNSILSGPFDLVLSDAAPATTGHKDVDAARSFQLCRSVLDIAAANTRSGGRLVCKIFQGGQFQEFIRLVNKSYQTVKRHKPQSSRKSSKEIYVIGIGKT